MNQDEILNKRPRKTSVACEAKQYGKTNIKINSYFYGNLYTRSLPMSTLTKVIFFY